MHLVASICMSVRPSVYLGVCVFDDSTNQSRIFVSVCNLGAIVDILADTVDQLLIFVSPKGILKG